MYFNGMYHAFFQGEGYRGPPPPLRLTPFLFATDWLPEGTGWGHVVSADLAHWTHVAPALRVEYAFDGRTALS
jgi:sucrose-6-phosphate hydrolase SacC (GH32 family)